MNRSTPFCYGGHGLPSRVFSSFELGYFEMIAYIQQPPFFLLFFTSHLITSQGPLIPFTVISAPSVSPSPLKIPLSHAGV